MTFPGVIQQEDEHHRRQHQTGDSKRNPPSPPAGRFEAGPCEQKDGNHGKKTGGTISGRNNKKNYQKPQTEQQKRRLGSIELPVAEPDKDSSQSKSGTTDESHRVGNTKKVRQLFCQGRDSS